MITRIFDDFRVTHEYGDIVAGGDHYPFGLAMDGRQVTREPYRYGYQGQFSEKDEETGWNSFEARQWDAKIGRWISPDPSRQYYSSYLGMGNNPVIGVDPDGRFSRFGAWWRSKFISNSYTYNTGTEWAVGWDTWENDGQGAYLLGHSITEGGPGLGKDFMTFDGVLNIGLTATVSPGVGGSIEMGVAIEHKPEYFRIRPYITLDQTWGGDLSIGGIVNYHKPNRGRITMADIEGWGESYNGGIYIFDGTFGGNSLNSGLYPSNNSDIHNKYHTYGFGVSAGEPVGFTRNKGYTWVFFND